MPKFFRLLADTDVADYVRPSLSLYNEPCGSLTLAEAVRQGKVQFIDPKPLTVGLSDDGGLEFPDLLLYEGVPLLSTKFSELLAKLDVLQPFCKTIILKEDLLGYLEKYILYVPPRVKTLSEVGRYGIFMLTDENFLMATEEVQRVVEVANLENVYFEEL